MGLFRELIAVQASTGYLRRRGRIIILIALGLMLLGAALILIYLLFPPYPYETILIITVTQPLLLGIILLARRGYLSSSALLLLGIVSTAVLVGFVTTPDPPTSPFYLTLVLLIASLVLSPRHIWIVLVALLCGLFVASLQLPRQLLATPTYVTGLISSALLLGATSAICFIGARLTATALESSERDKAELAQTNATLTTVLEQHQATNKELANSLAAQQHQLALIAELSVPVIPVRADVLIVPLIGAIDSVRAEQLHRRVLDQIVTRRARVVILDVTGVPIVDTQVARLLLEMAQAAQLLGTRSFLVGIRAEVARTLIHLDIPLNSLEIQGTLQQALEYLDRPTDQSLEAEEHHG